MTQFPLNSFKMIKDIDVRMYISKEQTEKLYALGLKPPRNKIAYSMAELFEYLADYSYALQYIPGWGYRFVIVCVKHKGLNESTLFCKAGKRVPDALFNAVEYLEEHKKGE